MASDQQLPSPPSGRSWRLSSRLASVARNRVSWVRKSRWRVAACATILAAVAVAAFFGIRAQSADPVAPKTLAQLDAALQANDFAEAEVIARAILVTYSDPDAPQGLVLYAKGCRVAREAEHANGDEQRRLHRVAAGYFQQALDQRLPETLWKPAVFHAASSLNQARRHAACIRLLQNALDVGLKPEPALDRMLAEAYSRLPTPQPEKSLEHLSRYLQSTDQAPGERRAASLDRVEILIALNQDQEALEQLNSLANEGDGNAAQLRVLRARLLVRQAARLRTQSPSDAQSAAAQNIELLNQAMSHVERVRQNSPIDQAERRQADYLYGVCLRDLDDLDGAVRVFSAARRLHHGHASGIASGLAEAELLQQLDRHEEALGVFQKLLAEAPPPSEYCNVWVSLEGLRARLLAAYARWLGQHRYDEAIALTHAMPSLFPRDRALQLHGEARAEWAKHLLAEAETLPIDEAQAKISTARQQFRLAGVLGARTAMLRTTSRDHPEELWRSAENYLRGRDFRHAARMFRLYLDQDLKTRRAEALVYWSESLLALGELDPSLDAVNQVLETYAQHPAAYRARILGAQAHRAKGDLAAARALLRQNIENESLAPQSIEWRDSLFLLGELLHSEALLCEAESRTLDATEPNPSAMDKLRECFDLAREAARVLDEAIARYPEAPQAVRASYLVAESHRAAAKYPRRRLPSMSLDATRGAVRQDLIDELTKSVAAYERLIDQLTTREDLASPGGAHAGELRQLEKTMLRNAYFARADALFDLQRYEEAIRAYTLAANRYQNEPAALEAFVQIAGCHRRLHRAADAQGVLEHAKAVLGRLDPEMDFARTTRYGRKQWEELLTLLAAKGR